MKIDSLRKYNFLQLSQEESESLKSSSVAMKYIVSQLKSSCRANFRPRVLPVK